MDETFGNAIIGKSKLGYSADVKILNVDGSETRSACRIFFENGANWNFAVINVHLDEKSENVRMAQVKKLLEWLSEKSKILSLPHILCGDFNSLSTWTPECERQRSILGLEVKGHS